MALQTERMFEKMERTFVDVTYADTGQNLVDHFTFRNGEGRPQRLHVTLTNGQESFLGPFNPSPPDHTILPPSNLSWRKASRATNWSLELVEP